jgi:hypothetical protein
MKLVLILTWCVLAFNARAEVRDRRDELSVQSRRYREKHFPNGIKPPKHRLKSQIPQAGSPQSAPPPGGIGYGFTFAYGALLWTNSTIADYYIIAPTDLGQSVSYLYLTTTDRAQLGTESLVAYQGDNEPGFWIYDWAQPDGSQWQMFLNLPTDNPQYLTTRPDEFAVTRQMTHVRNGTWLLGFSGGQYLWKNEVYLFDFNRGDWDVVYSFDYSTTNLTDNIYVQGGNGWWGPIVETFDNYTNVNAVGFDLVRLFQDGNPAPLWLGPDNSSSSVSWPWQVLTFAPNTSFTVAVSSSNLVAGTYDLGTLCVTANAPAASFTLSSTNGLVSPFWINTPNSNSWDNTVAGLAPGSYSITFNPSPGQPAPVQQFFTINASSVTTVSPVPWLASTMMSGDILQFTWGAFSNCAYQLQYSTNFAQPAWTNLGAPIIATNYLMNASDSVGTDPCRFYRVVWTP